jgi:predicted DNA-binding transcriptional regulator AlpA
MTQTVIGARRLTEREVAERFGLSRRTLQQWRIRGVGPKYLKLGASVRYALDDIEAFERAGARDHTSDPGPAAA